MPDKNIVAVYGSLRQGLSNHPLLEGCPLLGTERVSGFFMRSLGGFPAIFPSDKGESITIELYEVEQESTMAHLDRLEGHPSWYKRQLIPTSQGEAWVYVMTEAYNSQPVVEGGDWVNYLSSHSAAR